MSSINYENAVADRYSKAAGEREPALCCPVEYNRDLLKIIPQEIIDRDYGCGDPSPFVNPGETVLDLGSGGGKLCYIAAQIVGSEGRVIGVDCNSEMLGLARGYQSEVAEKLGYDVVSFKCGIIQNLALDLERYNEELEKITQTGVENILERRRLEQRLSTAEPMVESGSVDCVVSNCVLNLVQPQDRTQLFEELFRVLKVGGRAAISDIVSDENSPAHMQNNEELWSGCISGAWREDEFLKEFEKAGFVGMTIAKRESEPWQTVEGIEFRSVTVVAYKPDPGACLEGNQALIYRGPFKQVLDDDGHTFVRGERAAVCIKTFDAYNQPQFQDHFFPVEPIHAVSKLEANFFDCTTDRVRSPQETKGANYAETKAGCGEGESCC
jgi:SAM-dependent methyltransferase